MYYQTQATSINEIISAITYESVVQINTEHECVRELADRMNKVEAKEIHEDAKNWTIVDGKELSAKHNEVELKEDDVYDKRLKFIKSKSLYKK